MSPDMQLVLTAVGSAFVGVITALFSPKLLQTLAPKAMSEWFASRSKQREYEHEAEMKQLDGYMALQRDMNEWVKTTVITQMRENQASANERLSKLEAEIDRLRREVVRHVTAIEISMQNLAQLQAHTYSMIKGENGETVRRETAKVMKPIDEARVSQGTIIEGLTAPLLDIQEQSRQRKSQTGTFRRNESQ